VPRLIRDFLQLYPHVNFQLFQNSTSVMLEQLRRGEIDYCLSSYTASSPDIHWSQLWTEQVYVFAHKDHPLAQQRTATLEQIAGEKFIVLKQGYGSRDVFDRLVASTGIQPRIAFEGEEVVGILEVVAANLGIALLPELAGIHVKDISKLTLTDYPCNRTIGLAWRKDTYLGPLLSNFVNF
jgi:DNA-binding transcriptional LysR family regulator